MPSSRNERRSKVAKVAKAATPRKKAPSSKPARTVRRARSATRPPKKAVARGPRPATPPPPPPSPEARAQAIRAGWEQSLAGLTVTERSTVGDVTVLVAAVRGARPHWFFVTSGLWPRGIELCFKAPQRPEDVAAPQWAQDAFRALVETAASPDRPALTDSQVLRLNAPFAPGSEMTSLAFTAEPTLRPVVTPHDALRPLLAVGLTRDEERIVREWSPTALLEVLAHADPLLLTDIERSSLLLSPRARTHIEQRVEREGSSLAAMWAATSALDTAAAGATWRLSAEAVETLVSLLKGRLGHHRSFAIHAAGAITMEVAPAERPALVLTGATPRLELSQPAARQLRSVLRPKAGRYAIEALPTLTFEVV